MRKIVAFLCALLFVAGVIVAPALHSIHTDDCESTGNHDATTCAMCQISATALSTPYTHIDTITIEQIKSLIHIPQVDPVDTSIPAIHPARAPPVC